MNVVMMNFFVGWTTPVNDIGTSEWCEDPKIEGKVVKVQLDIGAKVNFISSNVICKISRISLVFWATELDTSLSSSICQPASMCRYRARGLSIFRGDKVKMVIELGFSREEKKRKKWKLKQ